MKKLLIFFICIFIYCNCNAQDEAVKFELSAKKFLMGTEFEITAVHTNIDSCKKAMYYAFKEVERIEKITSNYKDTTEISYVNRNAFNNPVKISSELFGIIQRSIQYSDKYSGLFDITVGPLTDYWGFNSEHPIETEPDKNIIDSLLKFVGYKNIFLNLTDTAITFLKEGLKIDLGGIAKGYALDKASEVMRNKGVNNFLINGGGDIYVSGRKSKDLKWKVAIKHPRDNEKLAATVELENTGVLTSGDYERYRIINGIRYHHIFNPKTGFPAMESQSASVINYNCEEGVVLSKIYFILGKNGLKNLNEELPYFIIDRTGKNYYNNAINSYQLKIIK
ncbi:MAG TPA: FAD:protein FMN transferase [Ignavibacteria bacterium]